MIRMLSHEPVPAEEADARTSAAAEDIQQRAATEERDQREDIHQRTATDEREQGEACSLEGDGGDTQALERSTPRCRQEAVQPSEEETAAEWGKSSSWPSVGGKEP